MSRMDAGNGVGANANAGVSSGLLFEGRAVTPSRSELDVTFASFLRQEKMTWRELFEGFETLRAVTYSTSASFIRDLFDCVHDIEVIFGSDVSVKGDLSRLYAAQQVGVDAIKDEFGRAGKRLLQLLKENHLRLFYANYAVHRKVFILEGDGKRRVILGSANLSAAAFGGLQSEQLVVFDDDSGMYEAERLMYDALLKDTAPIPPDIFRKEGSVEIDEIPTFSKILRTREAFVVEPAKVGAPGSAPSSSDATVFVLRTEDLRRHFVNALPQVAGKPLALTADIIRKVKEQRRQNVLVKGIESREIPRLEVDPERAEVRYQNKALDLAPEDAEVAADAQMLDEFFRGYPLYFSGKVSELVQDYCAFLAWFFAAPFVCLARDAAVHNDCNVFRYPVCGVLYGKSNAGKTDLVKVLMRAMFGHQWWLIPRDFTMTTFYALAERGGSFPIVIDDISRDKFREPAVAIIKQDFRMGLYPVLVLSTNQDVRAVEPEVLKRSVVVHAEASMPVAMSTRNSLVTKVSKRITTALYRRYLAEMLKEWPEFTNEFHRVSGQEGLPDSADLVGLSSSVLRRVIAGALGSVPDWCIPVDINTLVAMNGRKIKDRMRSQWEYKPKSFQIDRRTNHLIMTVDDQMDRNDYRKDLPGYVLYDVRQDKVIMWLDKAEEFFAIKFSGRGLSRFARRLFWST